MQEFDHLVDHSVDSYGTWFFGIAVPSVRPYLPSLFLPTHLLTFVSIVPFLVLCLFHTITSFFHLISTMQATANFSSSTLPLWGLQLASQKITGKKTKSDVQFCHTEWICCSYSRSNADAPCDPRRTPERVAVHCNIGWTWSGIQWLWRQVKLKLTSRLPLLAFPFNLTVSTT